MNNIVFSPIFQYFRKYLKEFKYSNKSYTNNNNNNNSNEKMYKVVLKNVDRNVVIYQKKILNHKISMNEVGHAQLVVAQDYSFLLVKT